MPEIPDPNPNNIFPDDNDSPNPLQETLEEVKELVEPLLYPFSESNLIRQHDELRSFVYLNLCDAEEVFALRLPVDRDSVTASPFAIHYGVASPLGQ